jgi:outer membrane protein insertion porin family
VRLTDRFFLGQPQMRGFDIRGVGPRVLRKYYSRNSDGTFGAITTDRNSWADDALGGKYYYIGHAELEIPLGAGAREMGLRPSIFMDAGAVWGVTKPATSTGVVLYTDALTGKITTAANASDGTANSTYQKYDEVYVGNSPQPRVSIGIGVNWNSPFGPFRIDFAKVLKKVDGDDTQPITFNVGTQF